LRMVPPMGRLFACGLLFFGCAEGGRDLGPGGGDAGPRRDGAPIRVDAGARDAADGLDAPPGSDAGPDCMPEECDDGNLCTTEVCGGAGECMSVPATCDDGSACTMDSCAPSSGCVNTPVTVLGASCMMTVEASAGGTFMGDSSCAGNDHAGGCGAGSAPDVVLRFTLTAASTVTIDSTGSSYDTVLSLGATCGAEELGCDDDTAGGGAARLTATGLPPGTYYAVLDGKEGATGGAWRATVTITPSDVVIPFPSAGDLASPDHGYLWSAGSYIEGARTTPLASARQAVMHLVITENILSCDTQDMRLRINGVDAGTFSIGGGTRTLDLTFSFGAIAGPVYMLRYENARPVTGGCGSANFLPTTTAGSTLTLRP
jgi:hypothetical protein